MARCEIYASQVLPGAWGYAVGEVQGWFQMDVDSHSVQELWKGKEKSGNKRET
jgi:hypothetical protein